MAHFRQEVLLFADKTYTKGYPSLNAYCSAVVRLLCSGYSFFHRKDLKNYGKGPCSIVLHL